MTGLRAALLLLVALFFAAAASAEPTFEQDSDRPGSDFNWFTMPQPWPRLCQEACLNTSECVAWTYMKPNVRGLRAGCWLKSEVKPATPNVCCVSGVR
ncbi:MAG TPA: PAN domain-containing protein [Xanthobacteraceae bacterium]|nr:PAN domain-containing protein [Xanthobacteraceae bacterium]